jgi:hypothetical protein
MDSLQKGILIKDGNIVKSKGVYSGDVSSDTMQLEIDRLQVKYPTYTIQLFESDQDADFVSAEITNPVAE